MSHASELIKAAGFAFVDPESFSVFLTQRGPNISDPGIWGVPGGHIEKGESPLDGAMRECFEEIGIIPPHRVLGVIKLPKRKHVYALYVADAAPRSLERVKLDGYETVDFGWASLDAAPPRGVHPGIEQCWDLIRHLVENAAR